MDFNSIAYSLLGGALIGVSVTMMLLFNGRVTGISGIIASSLSNLEKAGSWRLTFLVGMVVGGLCMHRFRPDLFVNASGRGLGLVVLAGLLVGYGTVMAGGCTSGHGVCGISRLSVRSIIATLIFMLFGFLTVQTMRQLLVG